MSDTALELDSQKLQALQIAVNNRLAVICDREQSDAAAAHPLYGRLWQAISDQLLAGGKRLRPYLTILAYEIYGGQQQEAALDTAVAWELLHNSMLMHDDIIDRDYTRHGRPNVAGQYLDFYSHLEPGQQVHFAHSAELLAGDLVLSLSHRIVDESKYLTSQEKDIIRTIFYKQTFNVIGGEMLDSEVNLTDPTIDPRLVAELKTASYSLVGPLTSGAVLAGANDSQIGLLTQLSLVLGVGFQLADDLLGIFGDEQTTGKSASSDLSEGKRTMVVSRALQLMGSDNRQVAEQLLASPSNNNGIALYELIAATSVQQIVAEQLTDYNAKANSIIDQLALDAEQQQIFRAVVSLLLDREA